MCVYVCVHVCFRNVTESINDLLGRCSSATPGQSECENALRSMQVSSLLIVQLLAADTSSFIFSACDYFSIDHHVCTFTPDLSLDLLACFSFVC